MDMYLFRSALFRRVFQGCVIVLALLPGRVRAIDVAASSDKQTARVGRSLSITVVATRADSSEPAATGATLVAGSEWRAGGYMAAGERAEGGRLVKTWRFDLIAATPGNSRVIPVVYLAKRTMDLGEATLDSVVGAPVLLAVLPSASPSRRTWLLAAVVVLGLVVAAVTRSWTRRDRRRRRTHLPEPLQEAMQMLDQAHAHCREDRAVRFLSDVGDIVRGYVARRLGRPLPAATGAEVAGQAAQHVHDPDTLRILSDLLQRCGTARYAGLKVNYAELSEIEKKARDVLERLDCGWVSDDSAVTGAVRAATPSNEPGSKP